MRLVVHLIVQAWQRRILRAGWSEFCAIDLALHLSACLLQWLVPFIDFTTGHPFPE